MSKSAWSKISLMTQFQWHTATLTLHLLDERVFAEKEKALVESLRDPAADNQVFYIDEAGVLCSKHSGHAVDVENGALVLRRRRPITTSYPNATSHPLPAFGYNPVTGQITVQFEYDPAYPPAPPTPTPAHPSAPPPYDNNSTPKEDFEFVAPELDNPWPSPLVKKVPAWKQKTFLVTSIPSRKPRTFVDDAADFFSSSASVIASPFSQLPNLANPFGHGRSGSIDKKAMMKVTPGDEDASAIRERVSLDHVRNGDFDLRDDELLENERGEENEVDDDPDPFRKVRVIGHRYEQERPNPKARERKRWEIVPIRKERRRF